MVSTRRQKVGRGREGVWRFGTLAAIGLPVTTFALAAQQETADLLASSYKRNVGTSASRSTSDALRRTAPLYALKLRFTQTDAIGNDRVVAESRLMVEEGRSAEFRADDGVSAGDTPDAGGHGLSGPSMDVMIWRDENGHEFVEGHVEARIAGRDVSTLRATTFTRTGITFRERVILNAPMTWSLPTVLGNGSGVTTTGRRTTFVQLTITHANRGPPVRGPPATDGR